AVRRVRPDRQGRGGFLRRDRKVGRVEDPLGRRREGDQDAGPGVLLVTGRGPGPGGSGFDDRARRALSSDTRGGAPPRDQLSGSAPRGRRTSTVVASIVLAPILPEIQVGPAADPFRRKPA